MRRYTPFSPYLLRQCGVHIPQRVDEAFESAGPRDKANQERPNLRPLVLLLEAMLIPGQPVHAASFSVLGQAWRGV